MTNDPSAFESRHLARSLAIHAAGLALLAGGAALFSAAQPRYFFVEAGPVVCAGSYKVGERTELKKGAPGSETFKQQAVSAAPAALPAQDDFAQGTPKRETEGGKPGAEAAAAPGENGDGGTAADTVLAYLDAVRLHIERAKLYPQAARRGGLQGAARVSFTIGADGRTYGLDIENSSGYALLDKAALSTVLRANPFPAPLDGKPFRALVDISFRLRQ
ncbi:MAG: energy transducer TonB [Elusimicrobia bacterium]|nr:energy transducer TonB [Elusimicrobiota bacterium]